MRIHAIAMVALGLGFQGASLAADDVDRPELTQISTVRIANYGTPSTVITDRAQVKAVVDELRQLRSRAWRQASSKMTCYATLALLSGTKTVTLFRIRPDLVVERPPQKGQSSYSLEIGLDDLQGIGALLARLQPPKGCP